MRIALVTPFDPDATMGRYARLILPSLLKRHDVDVWCPLSSRLIEAPAPVVPFESSMALGDPRLDAYDLLLYQMGNDANHFPRILDLSLQRPGVHILHDFVLHHLVSNYYLQLLRHPMGYLHEIEKAYGKAVRRYAEETVAGRNNGLWETDLVSRYPLFEPVLANALGAVVHSSRHLEAVRAVFDGPSARIDLAVAPVHPRTGLSRSALGVPDDRVLMVSSGYINRTKLLHVVIEALHRSPQLAGQALFVIVGRDCPVESPRLRAMVRDYQLEDSVRFTGYQTEDYLHGWLQNADLCINLRRPNTEGASCSVIEQMRHGKPVVVLREGFYAELPEDAVIQAEPDKLDRLHELLLRVVSDKALRERTAAAAREYSSSRFDADCYGERLSDFLQEVLAARPRMLLRHRVGTEIAALGSAAADLIGPYARRTMHRLFVTGEPPAARPGYGAEDPM